MTYGITPQGFVRKTYEVILAELQAKARSGDCFGAEVDLSDENFIGPKLKLMAWALASQWELAEDVYYSLDLDNAEGVALNRVVGLGLVGREAAADATVDLTFTGVAGSVIPVGTICETARQIQFATLTSAIIADNGTVAVAAQCVDSGEAGNVPANSIVHIKNPISGVDTVTNLLDAQNGKDIETDAALRARYKSSPASSGSNIDAVIAAVSKVSNVESVTCIENDSSIIDSYGLSPHSFEVIVDGGDNINIAQAIYSRKPAGIQSYGSVEQTVVDSQGQSKVIRFSRPVRVYTYVKFILETNSEWDSEQEAQIKLIAIAYVNALGNGKDVYAWKIAALLKDVVGLENVQVLIGVAADAITSDKILVSLRQRAVTASNYISFEYQS